MTRHEFHQYYLDTYEYHGNTTVEITRIQNGITLSHDWMLFDTIEEAQEYFHDRGIDEEAYEPIQ